MKKIEKLRWISINLVWGKIISLSPRASGVQCECIYSRACVYICRPKRRQAAAAYTAAYPCMHTSSQVKRDAWEGVELRRRVSGGMRMRGRAAAIAEDWPEPRLHGDAIKLLVYNSAAKIRTRLPSLSLSRAALHCCRERKLVDERTHLITFC